MSDSGRTGDVFLVVEGELVTWGVFIRPTRRKVFPLAMMMWFGAFTLAFAASGWAGSPPAKPADCEVYETDSSSVTVGFKVGNLLLQVGPEITLSKKRGVDWKEPVQKMIARFVEVCTRYNAGVVTKQEYDGRIQEIEDLTRE